MDYHKAFAGKKVTVMGLGLLGRAAGDAEYLARAGADLIVTDLKTERELASSVGRLRSFPNVHFVLGEHRREDFRDRDFILKAAGVPLDSPYIAEARKEGIPIEMSASLFAAHARIPVVGVTGTRGKSTVTHLIHAILTSLWDPARVLLGGNVRGVSTLALLDHVRRDSVAVLELDSWQLQGFGERAMSPHVAVFTNLLSDHLNYYHGDIHAYFKDKANIYRFQAKNDTLVVSPQVAELLESEPYPHPGKSVVVTEDDVPRDWELKIPGIHNRANVAYALAAVRALGITPGQARGAVEAFAGVPGRLEFLEEQNGIRIYNDNNATTPDATLAALDALATGRNIVLIMGGADKGLDMGRLLERTEEVCKAVILLPGTGTDRVRSALPHAPLCADVHEAVREARARASHGDIILFSPAFASFGMFANEYERNDALLNALGRTP